MRAEGKNRSRWWCFGVLIGSAMGGLGCPPSAKTEQSSMTDPPTIASANHAPSSTSKPVAPKPTAEATVDCSAVKCKSFATPQEALQSLLTDKVKVVAVGEAHAQKGTESIPSSTQRFREQLLPLFKGKSEQLIVELMAPNNKCQKETKKVIKKQQVVTKPQKATNQNEYLQLGSDAKKLGITPFLLRPSCEELAAIDKAGDDAIEQMLKTIASLTEKQVVRSLKANGTKQRIVLTYGGALHNDIQPKKGREDWSFGPNLDRQTNEGYLEVDLIVPEFIKDSSTWKALPWYPYYDKQKHGGKVMVMNPAPRSYVIIFATHKPQRLPDDAEVSHPASYV
jgi:hypothetical protein